MSAFVSDDAAAEGVLGGVAREFTRSYSVELGVSGFSELDGARGGGAGVLGERLARSGGSAAADGEKFAERSGGGGGEQQPPGKFIIDVCSGGGTVDGGEMGSTTPSLGFHVRVARRGGRAARAGEGLQGHAEEVEIDGGEGLGRGAVSSSGGGSTSPASRSEGRDSPKRMRVARRVRGTAARRRRVACLRGCGCGR